MGKSSSGLSRGWVLPWLLAWSGAVLAQVTGGVVVDPDREPTAMAPSLEMWVGRIKVLNNQAWVDRGATRYNAALGMALRQHDVVVTGANGSVGITFNDNSTLSIGPNTQIEIQRFSFDTTTHLGYFDTRLHRGTMAVQPGHIARATPGAMRVMTPAAELRGRAAGYLVSVKGDGNE